MSKANKGTKVVENKADTCNEFAPTVLNPGDGTVQTVDPAKTPAASMRPVAPEAVVTEEYEFLTYVKGELTAAADRLGYDVVLKKRVTVTGPVMMYDPDSREGKVFDAREEAPMGYITGDELQALYAAERDLP